jgi:hypothetical protein
MEKNKEKDHLILKWGTLKGWNFNSEKGKKLLKEYFDIGSNMSAIMQKDTKRQKKIICELIDEGDFEKVYLDWEGKNVSKKEAKKYVIEYG